MIKRILFFSLSFSLIFSCNQKNKEKSINTKPSIPIVRNNGLKIAFYNQDSLKVHFDFYKKMDEQVKKKQLSFQSQLSNQEAELRQFISKNEERAKLGQLSAFEIQSIQQQAQSKEQALYQLQQTKGASLEKETVDLLNVIGKKIEVSGKKYCDKYNIDILMVQSAGSQFNFINPTMEVTNEFIEFLNNEQKTIEKDYSK